MPQATPSRRRALAVLLGALPLMPRGARAQSGSPPVRLALSESLVSGVNINDARAAMLVWLKQMMAELNIVVEFSPRVFETTEEIIRRARTNQFDAVALNILEYRQIVEFLDPRQIVCELGAAGLVQYLMLAKPANGIARLTDLRGRRLLALDNTRMCVSSAWLSNLLGQAHLPPPEQFFGAIATDPKPSRVILPVFFGQADACLTTKSAFDTMSELNPQVGREIKTIAVSPPLVTAFYAFHKDYHGPGRSHFAGVSANMPTSGAGRQLATLFQFDRLESRDAAFLAPTLAILEAADRLRRDRTAGVRK